MEGHGEEVREQGMRVWMDSSSNEKRGGVGEDERGSDIEKGDAEEGHHPCKSTRGKNPV